MLALFGARLGYVLHGWAIRWEKLQPAMSDTEISICESKTQKKMNANAAVQTGALLGKDGLVAPQFVLVPPTPTTVRPTTPPSNGTPSWSPLLSPTSPPT